MRPKLARALPCPLARKFHTAAQGRNQRDVPSPEVARRFSPRSLAERRGLKRRATEQARTARSSRKRTKRRNTDTPTGVPRRSRGPRRSRSRRGWYYFVRFVWAGCPHPAPLGYAALSSRGEGTPPTGRTRNVKKRNKVMLTPIHRGRLATTLTLSGGSVAPPALPRLVGEGAGGFFSDQKLFTMPLSIHFAQLHDDFPTEPKPSPH